MRASLESLLDTYDHAPTRSARERLIQQLLLLVMSARSVRLYESKEPEINTDDGDSYPLFIGSATEPPRAA